MRPAPRLLLCALSCLLSAPAFATNPLVRFDTTLGSFDIELCAEVSDACPGIAPNTVANFLHYVDENVYPPTMFIHRRGAGGVSPLVIQGGGFWINGSTPTVVPKFDPIALELGANLSNLHGTIAMARGTAPDTATSQWFINLVDNVTLDTAGGGYAVFGNVVSGLPVVDAIGALTIWNAGAPLTELPLLPDYPGSGTAIPYLVYVSSIERVPEAESFCSAICAAAALGALAVRRRG